MTNEQRKAIEYIQKQIDYFKEQIKFIEVVDCDYYEEEYELYKNRIKQFSTVLSLIKEQQKEIEKYKTLYERALADLVKADELVEAHEWFYSEFDNFTKEDFIKYFADLVKKE